MHTINLVAADKTPLSMVLDTTNYNGHIGYIKFSQESWDN